MGCVSGDEEDSPAGPNGWWSVLEGTAPTRHPAAQPPEVAGHHREGLLVPWEGRAWDGGFYSPPTSSSTAAGLKRSRGQELGRLRGERASGHHDL